MGRTKVILRADGNSTIGLGHVIRSLALAEILKDNFECVFATQAPSIELQKQIELSCETSIMLPLVLSESDGFIYELDDYLDGTEIVVLDGYVFQTAYQKHIQGKGCKLVCIDDIHAYHFVADIVINHGTLDKSVYSYERHTTLLLGPKYSLLRKPFLENNSKENREKKSNDVFLCFGGADGCNLTSTYLKRILEYPHINHIHIVVGSAFKHMASLQAVLGEARNKTVFLYYNVTAEKLVDIIGQCKIAVVPGSTISLECASVGIGMISGFYVSNQIDISTMLSNLDMALLLGDFKDITSKALFDLLDAALWNANQQKMIERQKEFFDGQSGRRLLSEILKLAS